MALTRPRLGQFNTTVSSLNDPITVLNGTTAANIDIGFLMNRANGLVSNVALYWNETNDTFALAFTETTGATNSNITPTSYANIRVGTLVANTLSVAGGGINGVTIGSVTPAEGTFTTLTATTIKTDDYQYANGSPFVSTTLANTAEITANLVSGQNVGLNLTATGVTAGNYGSPTSIPTIVVDSKGRITSLTANTLNKTVSLSGTTGSGSVDLGGTLSVNGTANQTTTSVSGSTITVGLAQNITTPGNLTVAGNLMVYGNTVTINSTNLAVTDSVIDLHTNANLEPLTFDDGLDVGIRFNYYTDSYKKDFLGWNNFSQSLQYLSNVTETSSNIQGTYGNVEFGSLRLYSNILGIRTVTTTSANVAETTGITGALFVQGGIGSFGNVNFGKEERCKHTMVGNLILGFAPTGDMGDSYLTINASTYPPLYDNNLIHLQGRDGLSARMTIDVNNDEPRSSTFITARRARGTSLAPNAVQNGDRILNLGGRGYGTTGYLSSTLPSTAAMDFYAGGAHTDTSQPTYIDFFTTAVNSVTPRPILRLESAGNVSVLSNANSTNTTTGALIVAGGAGIAGNVNVGGTLRANIAPVGELTDVYITGNVVPTANVEYDIGTADKRFRSLYLSGSTIYLGNAVITSSQTGDIIVETQGSFAVPVGNTLQRSAVQGAIRYNTTLSAFETFDGANWNKLAYATASDFPTGDLGDLTSVVDPFGVSLQLSFDCNSAGPYTYADLSVGDAIADPI